MAALAQTALRHVPDVVESDFAGDVIAGLSARPKQLSPKYFYDELGAQLFEEITRLPEYYPTRCELAILEKHAAEMAQFIPADAALIEFGSGSTRKARMLLNAAPSIARLCAGRHFIRDASAGSGRAAARLSASDGAAGRGRFYQAVPSAARDLRRPRVGFFPGSTIGNFEPHAAAAFLRHAASMLGKNSTLIIGFDLVKDVSVLNAAYNDAAHVTARFNLNLLTRINRELGGNFDLGAFCHQAFYNTERHRIEMHLASRKRQKVRVAGRSFEFRAGETIHTENSYKYTLKSFGAMARGSGWTPVAAWTDPNGYFSVQALKSTAA